MIALHAAVHDGSVALLRDALLCNVRIDPVRKAPLLWRDLAPLYWSADVLQNNLAEGLIEVSVVEEDVGVVKPSVEMSLNRLY